jgi:ElaB/YqjD/DUF883 family membrane-anchored ribosome-binding protein
MVEAKVRPRGEELESPAAKKQKTSSITETLKQGEIPSTQEISQVIEQAKETLSESNANLSDQGKRISSSISNVLDASQELLNKNRGDLLQQFLKAVIDFSAEVVESGKNIQEETKDEQYEAMKASRDLVENIRSVVTFTLQSSDFRQLLNQSVEFMQNVSGLWREGDTNKIVKLTDDQKNELKERFASIMKTISGNEEYNNAYSNLLRIFDQVNSMFSEAQKEQPFKSESFDNMLVLLDMLFKEFFGQDEWSTLKIDYWRLINSIKKDEDFNNFFQDFTYYMKLVLNNPNDISSGPVIRRGQELMDKVYTFMDKTKHRDDIRRLFNHFQHCVDHLVNDKALNSFGDSITQLVSDLFTDSQGRPDIYVTKDSIVQLKELFLPVIRDKLQNIPLPRIEGSNDTYDYWIDDMKLDGTGLLPEHFHMRVVNDVKMDANESDKDKIMTKIHLNIDNIRMAFKDMKFYYNRKTIPKIEDSGTANIELAGDGLQFKLTWKVTSKKREPIRMELSQVKCNIDELNIQIKDSKHIILDGIISKLFNGYIKEVVAQAIVDKIKDTMEPFNDQVNEVFRKQKLIFDQKMSDLGDQLEQKTKKSWVKSWNKQ